MKEVDEECGVRGDRGERGARGEEGQCGKKDERCERGGREVCGECNDWVEAGTETERSKESTVLMEKCIISSISIRPCQQGLPRSTVAQSLAQHVGVASELHFNRSLSGNPSLINDPCIYEVGNPGGVGRTNQSIKPETDCTHSSLQCYTEHGSLASSLPYLVKRK